MGKKNKASLTVVAADGTVTWGLSYKGDFSLEARRRLQGASPEEADVEATETASKLGLVISERTLVDCREPGNHVVRRWPEHGDNG